MPTARSTTVALDPSRALDAAHAFMPKLSTLVIETTTRLSLTCLPSAGTPVSLTRSRAALLKGEGLAFSQAACRCDPSWLGQRTDDVATGHYAEPIDLLVAGGGHVAIVGGPEG